jgi:hypothetical protein
MHGAKVLEVERPWDRVFSQFQHAHSGYIGFKCIQSCLLAEASLIT